jgi:hypothetical protein
MKITLGGENHFSGFHKKKKLPQRDIVRCKFGRIPKIEAKRREFTCFFLQKNVQSVSKKQTTKKKLALDITRRTSLKTSC